MYPQSQASLIIYHEHKQKTFVKEFIETKINFSPSPLWFSKSVLWVLATTFHDSFPKPSLLIQQHVYWDKRKEKTTYTTGHFGTINSYSGSFAGMSLLSNNLLFTEHKVFVYDLLCNGCRPQCDQRCNTVIMSTPYSKDLMKIVFVVKGWSTKRCRDITQLLSQPCSTVATCLWALVLL